MYVKTILSITVSLIKLILINNHKKIHFFSPAILTLGVISANFDSHYFSLDFSNIPIPVPPIQLG